MNTFSALADSTRRSIVEMLASDGQLSASDICERFFVSPPAISQHLKILREAHLVRVEKKAQQRLYTVDPEGISEMEQWAKQVRKLWSERFDALEELLETQKRKSSKKPKNRKKSHGKSKHR